jgi:protein involved in polysaccharide export with SLBB domain
VKLRVLVMWWVAAALAACGVSVPKYDYAQEPDPRNSEYVLGVGDDLAINVW